MNRTALPSMIDRNEVLVVSVTGLAEPRNFALFFFSVVEVFCQSFYVPLGRHSHARTHARLGR